MQCVAFVLIICAFLIVATVSYNLVVDENANNGGGEKSGCKCSTYSCGCCEYVSWFNGSVCSNFTLLPKDYGISFVVTFRGYPVINETISVRNPPPICAGIPELEKINAEICLKLHDLEFKHEQFSGCLDVGVYVYHLIHKSITVGCFHLPPGKAIQFHSEINATKFADISYIADNTIDIKEIENMPRVQLI